MWPTSGGLRDRPASTSAGLVHPSALTAHPLALFAATHHVAERPTHARFVMCHRCRDSRQVARPEGFEPPTY